MPLFLDNNVFSALTEKEGVGDPGRFLADVRTAGLVATGAKMLLRMSPSTLLEAIGVVPPPAKLKMKPMVVAKGRKGVPEEAQIAALAEGLLDQAISFYENCSEISEANLQAKAEEQRAHKRPGSLDFFDKCVSSSSSSAEELGRVAASCNTTSRRQAEGSSADRSRTADRSALNKERSRPATPDSASAFAQEPQHQP